MYRDFSKKFFSLALIISVIFLGFLVHKKTSAKIESPKLNYSTLNRYAANIVKLCAKERYHPACYDNEIPKLLGRISIEDAFRVIGIVQSRDPSFPYCHVLGHKLSALEVAKNPSKWKDVITRVPAGMCSGGGIHGAFQERFKTESLAPEEIEKIKPELGGVCEKRPGWNPSSLERGTCYHALGHLAMYLTTADIKASLDLCDAVGKKENGTSSSCYDGAFMQLFQPLEPEDFDLISGKEIKPGQLKIFCGKFDGEQRGSCWREGWPLVRGEIMTPSGLVGHCSSDFLQEESLKDRCYITVFYSITVQMKFNMKSFGNFCSKLPDPRNNECFSAGATRLISTDYRNMSKAAAFCASANNRRSQNACYDKLVEYSLYSFRPGSKESIALCNSLPRSWKSKCDPNHKSSSQTQNKKTSQEDDNKTKTYPAIPNNIRMFFFKILKLESIKISKPESIDTGCLNVRENQTCWRNFLIKILEEKGLGEAFEVLAKLYDIEPVFASNCHSYTHELGEKAYTIFSKDKELEMTPKASYCGYGFYHGFMETLLHSGGTVKEAQEFCSYADEQLSFYGKKTNLACYHGIGHGAVDGGDPRSWGSPQKLIQPGLDICRTLSGSPIQIHQCGTGVFNALAIAFNSNKFGLYFTEDPYQICLNQDEDFKKACYSQMNTRVVYLSGRNFDLAVKFVLNIPDEEYAIFAMNQLAPAAINDKIGQNKGFQNEIKVCRSLPLYLGIPCIDGLAGGIMEFGKPDYEYVEAMDFCRSLEPNELEKKRCYGHIVSGSKILYSKEKARRICKMIDLKYREQCT